MSNVGPIVIAHEYPGIMTRKYCGEGEIYASPHKDKIFYLPPIISWSLPSLHPDLTTTICFGLFSLYTPTDDGVKDNLRDNEIMTLEKGLLW